ncbi:MAG: hypothetical protein IJM30_00940 [Thermoguttaceae bacterium]|nr:hypothetical protein [Thermoguttaceae bacterium]MBQ9873011.1 hypothetical protein [Thermoguttaceae bacterium]
MRNQNGFIEVKRSGVALLAALVVFLAQSGCNRLPPKPEGLPELYPCVVTATFGGKPVEGVRVALTSTDPGSRKWRSGGATDAKGRCVVKTAFYYKGAPEGAFKISFAKTEEQLGDTIEEMQPLSLIPIKYSPMKSTLTVEVKREKNEFSFELDGGEERFPIPKGSVPPPRFKTQR